MIRAVLLALVLAVPALAHGLSVFAWREGEELVVEATFGSGRAATAGTIRLYDAADALLATHPVSGDGATRVPLTGLRAAGGLRVEVDAGDGHSDYWILTPEDLAAGEAGR